MSVVKTKAMVKYTRGPTWTSEAHVEEHNLPVVCASTPMDMWPKGYGSEIPITLPVVFPAGAGDKVVCPRQIAKFSFFILPYG